MHPAEIVPEPQSLIPTRIWYLEMASRGDLRAKPLEVDARRSAVPLGALNAFFYREIGRDFHWMERLGWTPDRWQAWAERTELWILYVAGTPAGYAELNPRGETVDLAFFGLLEPFRGRGLGGAFLSRVVERMWELGPQRITVNTCELDGPYARAHYEARGFRVVREALEQRPRSGA